MTFKKLRNEIVRQLAAYLQVTIVHADQTEFEPFPPYGYYSILTHREQSTDFGDCFFVPENESLTHVRREQVNAVFSFTFVGKDREAENGYIDGEDEALELAEKAISFFNHSGYPGLSKAGIVVNGIMDMGNRSFLKVDNMSYEYGFDVSVKYVRLDKRLEEIIQTIDVKKGF